MSMIRRFFDAVVAIAIVLVVVLAIMNREKFSSMTEKKSAPKPQAKIENVANTDAVEVVTTEEQGIDGE